MTENGTEPGLNFNQSVEHNIEWIKRLTREYDVSQGMVANAVIMTMLMMDHHRFDLRLNDQAKQLEKILELLCQSNSSPEATKVLNPSDEPM